MSLTIRNDWFVFQMIEIFLKQVCFHLTEAAMSYTPTSARGSGQTSEGPAAKQDALDAVCFVGFIVSLITGKDKLYFKIFYHFYPFKDFFFHYYTKTIEFDKLDHYTYCLFNVLNWVYVYTVYVQLLNKMGIPSTLSSIAYLKNYAALSTGTDKRVSWDWVETCRHKRSHSRLLKPPRDSHKTPASVKIRQQLNIKSKLSLKLNNNKTDRNISKHERQGSYFFI